MKQERNEYAVKAEGACCAILKEAGSSYAKWQDLHFLSINICL
jgi:hypothetical protein